MKKIIIPGLIAALALSSVAKAELELSGNVTTVTVYQHDDEDASAAAGVTPLTAGGATISGLGITDCENCDHFRFVVDQVELDVENEFGDNIRARADIDFRDVAGSQIRAFDVMDLEQGYVTANLGIGNGMEFLIGKFNAPLGLESVDRHENVFTLYSYGWAYMAPKSVMGAKFYYEFSDNWNMDFALVNNLNGGIAGSAYPSGIFRVGAMWGEEGNETYIHLGLGYGPEHGANNGNIVEVSQNMHHDYYVNLWGNWSIGDFWDLGWEAIGRQSNSVGTGRDQKAVGGQLYLVYQASDVWSLQFGGSSHWELNPAPGVGGNPATASGASLNGANWSSLGGAGTGFEGFAFNGTIGATYMIADDAAFKFEGRWDDVMTAGARGNADYMTGALQFAYSF